ncbi:MAG: hypothetical protein AAGA44_06210 [Pseudomonadota bacterium]
MTFRASPNAFVMGSETAGADGDVSRIVLPGGQNTTFSDLGMFDPDGSPTQQVGIVADYEVRPTLEGIRDSKDEVLDAAIELVKSSLSQ